MITITNPMTGKGENAATILRALPQWFGIEEATQHYINYANDNPTFYAMQDDTPVGFLSLYHHAPKSAEIYVMGVLPTHHRQGIGKQLIQAAEAHLRKNGTHFLQVKTLSDKHPDEGYAKTRKFYLGMGFVPLEEFHELWGKHNPCLQLIKYLGD